MAHFNDLKARYSHVFDRLSEVNDVDLEAVSGNLLSLDANLADLEVFIIDQLGSVISVEDVVVKEVPVEEPPAEPVE